MSGGGSKIVAKALDQAALMCSGFGISFLKIEQLSQKNKTKSKTTPLFQHKHSTQGMRQHH